MKSLQIFALIIRSVRWRALYWGHCPRISIVQYFYIIILLLYRYFPMKLLSEPISLFRVTFHKQLHTNGLSANKYFSRFRICANKPLQRRTIIVLVESPYLHLNGQLDESILCIPSVLTVRYFILFNNVTRVCCLCKLLVTILYRLFRFFSTQ